jgi:hypothetical protein
MTLDRVLAANRRHRPADISRCRTGRPTRARPEFRLAEAPRGAEELGSMVVHRITALTPEQVSGGNNAPALRFANLETHRLSVVRPPFRSWSELRFGMNSGATPATTAGPQRR